MMLANFISAILIFNLVIIVTGHDVHICLHDGQSIDTNCTSTHKDRPIPQGYEKFENSYYKFHRSPKVFADARRVCEMEGGYLAIINSDREARFLAEMFKRYPEATIKDIPISHNNYALIGFHDLFKDREFVTIRGESLERTGYTRWQAGQPDNTAGNEHCGSMYRAGTLNDFPCNVATMFICEFNYE